MTLTTHDMMQIQNEATLGQKSTLTTDEALQFRKQLEKEIQDIINSGLQPETTREW